MLKPSSILKRNGANLMRKKDVLKKPKVMIVALNMQKDS
jgi:hypothetical protein